MKTCTKCMVEKPLEEFYTRSGVCKECKKVYQRDYAKRNAESISAQKKVHRAKNRERLAARDAAYYAANRERLLAKQRTYYEANRERIAEYQKSHYEANREEITAYKKAYYEANREKFLERSRAYREANREEIAEYKKAYYEANPDNIKAASHRRRARKRSAAGSATAQDIQNRLDAHGHKCIFCGSTEDLHVDHVKPLSKGGSNWPSNLAPACGSCNLSKHAKWGQDLVDWGTERFGAERVKSWPFPQK